VPIDPTTTPTTSDHFLEPWSDRHDGHDEAGAGHAGEVRRDAGRAGAHRGEGARRRSGASVTITAKGALKLVRIDPSLMREDEAEILRILILAAFNDAKAKSESCWRTR
jgi:hypothetical protein